MRKRARRLGHRRKGRGLVALLAQLDGLQGAHVARHQGEDGDTEAPLDEHPEEGQLEQARGGILGGDGAEEVAVKGAGDVREQDEDGGEAAYALGSLARAGM